MASTITHAYFILDVYDKLDLESKKLLIDQKELLKISAQGMDPLFFYNITKGKKGQRIREFGDYYHNNNTKDFFITMINYIKYNGYARNGQVMAYLYGLLSHMVLDSNIHPYIIYKTGEFNKKDKTTYKYNMLHGEVESYIDNYLISLKTNINPYKFKCHKACFNIPEFNNTVTEVINFTFKEVFDINNMTKFYIKSVKDMKSFFKIFRYDPYGIKKIFYKFIDLISPKSFRRKTPLSYHINNKKEYLNLNHKAWYNPTDKKIKNNTSIIDIYTNAVNECKNLINEINEYIYNDNGDINKIIKNTSYITGLEIDKNKKLKFFEF